MQKNPLEIQMKRENQYPQPWYISPNEENQETWKFKWHDFSKIDESTDFNDSELGKTPVKNLKKVIMKIVNKIEKDKKNSWINPRAHTNG